MNYLDLPKEACFTPILSPRSSLSKTQTEMDRLTTNLAINIDKYILGFFKDAFEFNKNQLNLNEFISHGLKNLKSWQRELKYRDQKIYECLQRLFMEADNNHKGYITWNQFNSMLIEKGLNLKSLRNQEPGNTNLMKQIPNHGFTIKHNNPIEKMVNIGNKIAIFSEQSNQIDFYNLDGSLSNFKSLILNQQALIVQTSIAKRNKQGTKEIHKKEIMVAQYKNILLDMIYINDSKYSMLITSSTDFKIRGWDISSNSPVLAKQPQNQDEKMEHQFPIEIHTMAWDNINEVLYCCGKEPTIYEWMIKTDSERQLVDPDGHTDMISAMIMMPKLQFLATGGYDGKLILWDTISQTKKFKYKEHTRSISSMAFHQGLILLFTSAYDHSICVWNPYIQSLIHKIFCNVNIVRLDIIPETNLLLALDGQSNVKIRQINKFSLVSSFTIQKSQHKPEQICMITTKDPIRYYFSGANVSVFQYVQIDANVIHDAIILCLKYNPENFMLYCPIKNHIIIWNLLTGTIATTLRHQTTSEITAFDIIKDLKISVLGDFQGNLILRKMENGILIKKLYKHRTNIIYILTYSIGSERFIFSASYDGQIAVFQRDTNGDFNNTRTIAIKKINALASVTSLSYQHERNILIIGTQIGQIYFLDIDKNKMISKCQTKAGDVQHFIQIEQQNILLSFCKKSEIFGLYLPPHLKKYKPSCHLINQHQISKISSITMSKKNKRCYLGFQNGDLLCFILSVDVISDNKHQQNKNKHIIKHVWKHNFGQAIRNLILIQQENYIVTVVGNNNILILSCEQGQKIAQLNEKSCEIELQPILYFDEEKQSIYIKSLDREVQLVNHSKHQIIQRVFDPFYYLEKTEKFQSSFNLISNNNWKFQPNLTEAVQKNINRNLEIYKNVQEFQKIPKKSNLIKVQSQPFSINKAVQLHKKWQKQKEQDDTQKNQKQLNHSSYSAANLTTQKYTGLNKQILRESKIKTIQINHDNKSPLYRLGLALRSLNQKDTKAIELMQIAQRQFQKSKNLKLPKINAKK